MSTALMAEGVLATSRSIKYRRHRGPYCLTGDCGTCLVRIDGVPNVRACMTTVRDGMQVEPQNRLLEVGPDPTALVDKIFVDGMDHHHFMVRPRVANVVMQGVARHLAGLGTLPARPPAAAAHKEEHRPDLLVVGAGPAGHAAATAGRRGGLRVLLVDRLDRRRLPTGEAHGPDPVLDATGVFGAYPQEGLWAAITRRPSEPDVLVVIRPRHVVVATGARDSLLPVPGNDIPGVVSARGLVAMLRQSGLELAAPCVVVGSGIVAEQTASTLGATRVDPQDVERIEGHQEVESIRLRDRSITCALVALAPRPAPAFELAKQAGARVRFDGSGFAVVRDEEGRCASDGPWGLWAAGDVSGYLGPRRAAEDAREVGEAVVRACRGED